MKTFTATYGKETIQVKANNQRSAHYEAKKVFTDAHWSELSVTENK